MPASVLVPPRWESAALLHARGEKWPVGPRERAQGKEGPVARSSAWDSATGAGSHQGCLAEFHRDS